MQRRPIRALLVLLGTLAGTAGAAHAACGSHPGDAVALSGARADVDAQCPCAGAASHKAYLDCAAGVIHSRFKQGLLPRRCVGAVHRCSAHSTCGKATAVACCLGSGHCKVTKTAARCAKKGGHPGAAPSCCDACGVTSGGSTTSTTLVGGGSTTTTTTPTGPTTTTTSTTLPEGYTCQHNSSGASVEPFACGSSTSCTLSHPGDSNAFTITVPAAASLSIEISGSNNPCWDLRDASDTSVKKRCSDKNPQEAGPLSEGTYTLVITEALNRISNYVLSVQGITESYHCGMPLTVPASIVGELAPAGDTDSYTFVATGGERVHVTSTGLKQPCWRLFSPGGALVRSEVCDGGADAGPLLAGTNTIVVLESLDRATTYTLSVDPITGP
jgi:hypothetical protein